MRWAQIPCPAAPCSSGFADNFADTLARERRFRRAGGGATNASPSRDCHAFSSCRQRCGAQAAAALRRGSSHRVVGMGPSCRGVLVVACLCCVVSRPEVFAIVPLRAASWFPIYLTWVVSRVITRIEAEIVAMLGRGPLGSPRCNLACWRRKQFAG